MSFSNFRDYKLLQLTWYMSVKERHTKEELMRAAIFLCLVILILNVEVGEAGDPIFEMISNGWRNITLGHGC